MLVAILFVTKQLGGNNQRASNRKMASNDLQQLEPNSGTRQNDRNDD